MTVAAVVCQSACRTMVEILAIAHERGCEAGLVALLAEDVTADTAGIGNGRLRGLWHCLYGKCDQF